MAQEVCGQERERACSIKNAPRGKPASSSFGSRTESGQCSFKGASKGKMVSPKAKRKAVVFLLGRGFSRTCCCRAAGLSRPASRHVPKERIPGLKEEVLKLAKAN